MIYFRYIVAIYFPQLQKYLKKFFFQIFADFFWGVGGLSNVVRGDRLFDRFYNCLELKIILDDYGLFIVMCVHFGLTLVGVAGTYSGG